ncbi:MAG: hypothetical protein V4597_11695 [Pseudomonadota bacterium]
MLTALLVFLVGALVLAVVIYIAKLLLAMFELPPPIQQIALLILGLIGLVLLIILCVHAFNGGLAGMW